MPSTTRKVKLTVFGPTIEVPTGFGEGQSMMGLKHCARHLRHEQSCLQCLDAEYVPSGKQKPLNVDEFVALAEKIKDLDRQEAVRKCDCLSSLVEAWDSYKSKFKNMNTVEVDGQKRLVGTIYKPNVEDMLEWLSQQEKGE